MSLAKAGWLLHDDDDEEVISNGRSPLVVIRSHMPTAPGKVILRHRLHGILPPYLYPNYLLTISPVFKFKTIS